MCAAAGAAGAQGAGLGAAGGTGWRAQEAWHAGWAALEPGRPPELPWVPSTCKWAGDPGSVKRLMTPLG